MARTHFEQFNIFDVFESTKTALTEQATLNSGKLAMLNDLIDYFRQNNLSVVREVADEETVQPVTEQLTTEGETVRTKSRK